MYRNSLFLLCLLASPALAQWSSDPASNLALGDGPNDQVQAKVAPTTDGGCYVSWYDNALGGYDVTLQRLDAAGNELWAHGGVLLVDRSVSSTTDYAMVTCANGDALITYIDNRSGSNQIAVQRVSPAGVLLFGPDGVIVSSGSGVSGNSRIAELTDGSIAVGWTQSPGWFIRTLTGAGAPLAGPLTNSDTGHTIFLCDLQPGTGGSVIALWSRSFGTNYATTAKWLLAQNYDASLAPLWTPAPTLQGVAVYAPQPNTAWPTGSGTYGTQGGSIQSGYFPYFLSDGAGGGVFGYYENGGPRNAYVQHILPDGSPKFPHPGIAANITGTNRIRVGNPGFDYDQTTGSYYIASVESDASPQTNYSTFVQLIDTVGTRVWGDTGVTVVPVTGFQQSSIQCLSRPDGGASVFGFDGRNGASSIHEGFAVGVSAEGESQWSNFFSTTVEAKSRLAAASSSQGFHILAFQSGATGNANLYTQNVNLDGSFGSQSFPCDPDLNQDGNVDQDDVSYLINVVGGGENPSGIDPDFNQDGNVDQDDVAALINSVGGGGCP